MSRVAIIGSGIAGLATGWLLSRQHEVWLFEQDGRLGGHTHTVPLTGSDGRTLPLDTGFLVHNEATYPNLVRLFGELGVATQASDMSFSVHDPRTGFEYSSRGLGGFFAQPLNRIRPGHYTLLTEILRFNREARRLLLDGAGDRWTIGDYLDVHRFGGEFVERYLYPMTSAIWSASFDGIRRFPALALVRFLANHGMLSVGRPPIWKTVQGGSSSYIAPITAPYRERVVTSAPVQAVSRCGDGVVVEARGLPPGRFDHVVFATHGDQVLPILRTPLDREREVLGAFATTRNDTWLHTDPSWLPTRPLARASWNYRLSGDPGAAPSVTYHLNRLQRIESPLEFCVTLNPDREIAPQYVVARMTYRHPQYSHAALAAQARWAEISGTDRIHYCGAYWYYGFHEDGLRSAIRVARALGVTWGDA